MRSRHPARRGSEFVTLVVLLMLAWTAACSTDEHAASPGGGPPAPAQASGRAPAPAPPAPTGARGTRGSGQPVTFAFAGDVQFGDQQDTEAGSVSTGLPVLADRVRADPTRVLAPVAPVLSGADLAMVNLETAITDRGSPVPGKAFHFRSPPASFDALRAAGVDVVTMANNHSLDYGSSGLQDTFGAISSSRLPVVGIGHDADEAYRPYVATIRGQRVGILAALDWLEPGLKSAWTATDSRPGLATAFDPARLLAAVRAARPHVDTLVVFMHWGTEQTLCADAEQSSLARRLAAAGADLVVGAHAHRVQGAGRIGRTFVAYGLGNFTWWREDGESGRTGVLRVTATGRHVDSYTWVPARIRRGIPVPLSGPAAAADITEWQHRRVCSGLSP